METSFIPLFKLKHERHWYWTGIFGPNSVSEVVGKHNCKREVAVISPVEGAICSNTGAVEMVKVEVGKCSGMVGE